MSHRIFIQARMNSTRFPGKMLSPFRGRPLISQVIERFRQTDLFSSLVVLTSVEPTDDPLADYVSNRCLVPVFRGELDNVVGRFQSALAKYPCEWFVRICGDSPLIDAWLVKKMIQVSDPAYDVVSNVVRRTFPSGQSVECVRSNTFNALRSEELTPDQREHVTKVFYDPASDWRVRSVICKDDGWADARMVIDSLEDLQRLSTQSSMLPSFGELASVES